MLMIDGSGSVGNAGFQQTLNFLKNLVGMYNIGANGTQFSLIVFGNIVDRRFDFNEYTTVASLQNAIASTP